MEVDISAYLRDLERVAERIAAMFEWQALGQQERGSRALPPFLLSYKNREELDELYAQFSFLCMSLNMILDDPQTNCTDSQRESWRREFRKLQRRVQNLNRSDGFIKA